MGKIFMRINEIFTANINDMLDRIEDPERMIKQIIVEMEENIRLAKNSVIEAVTSEKRLNQEIKHHRSHAEEWARKAESAVKGKNEDLARKALVRKKEHEKILKDVETSWEAAHETSETLKKQLRKLESKLEEARRKRSMLAARQHAAEARQTIGKTVSYFERGIHMDEKFDRMEDRVMEIEARSEAIVEIFDEDAELEKEFESFETDTEIDDELALLKQKIGDENKEKGIS